MILDFYSAPGNGCGVFMILLDILTKKVYNE